MQLSFHLFQSDVASFDDAIDKGKLKGKFPFQSVPLKNVAFNGVAYLQRNKHNPPPWLPFILNNCDIKNAERLQNQACSFAMLIQHNKRIFAITLGFGHTLLKEEKFEGDFGLRVTMNTVAKDRLKALQARGFGTAPVHRYYVASRESRRGDFDIDAYLDLVASLEGGVKDADPKRTKKARDHNRKLLGTKVAGSTSCSLTTETSFADLGKKCDQLIQAYDGKAYKDIFPEYDNVRLVHHKPTLSDLSTTLAEHVVKRNTQNFSLALPDISARGKIEHFEVRYPDAKKGTINDLNVSELFAYLDEQNLKGDRIIELKITGYDGQGNPVTPAMAFEKCAVHEAKYKGNLYTLTLGRWYLLDAGYVDRKEKEFAAKVKGKVIVNPKFLPLYPKVISQLVAPKGGKIDREGLYNEHACKQMGSAYCLMDKNLVNISTPVEVCDIFTKDRKFIHVKRGTGNATTSHLLSQGSVSATMFYDSAEYRGELISKLPHGMKHLVTTASVDCSDFTVVFALIDEAAGYPHNLSFFKKLNLLHHQRIVERMQFKTQFYHIPYE